MVYDCVTDESFENITIWIFSTSQPAAFLEWRKTAEIEFF